MIGLIATILVCAALLRVFASPAGAAIAAGAVVMLFLGSVLS